MSHVLCRYAYGILRIGGKDKFSLYGIRMGIPSGIVRSRSTAETVQSSGDGLGAHH